MDLHLRIGGTTLFEQLTGSFPIGKIIGLVGTNGCGKSTLLRMLAGLCQPHKGRIIYDDKPSIGYVPTAPMLYPFLTVKENLEWMAKCHRVSTETLPLLIATFNLKSYSDALFSKLSDGLKKRVCIASQCLHDPHLLLLDEPCATLDPKQRYDLWCFLKLYRAPHRLIIISSHLPDELATFCDAIYLLSHSKLLDYPFSSMNPTQRRPCYEPHALA